MKKKYSFRGQKAEYKPSELKNVMWTPKSNFENMVRKKYF
jgi:hypothetical protein